MQTRHRSSYVRSVRPREEGVQRRPEAWRRGERRQPERVDEHEAVEPIAVLRREARCDGAAQRDSHERRPRVARLLDQRVEPGDHVGCRPTRGRSRRSLSRQVRRDHAVCLRERRDDAAPVQGVRHGPVEQHDRRAFAPYQHRRRHARAARAAGPRRAAPRSQRFVPRRRGLISRLRLVGLMDEREARGGCGASVEPPNLHGSRWVVSPTAAAQTSWCSYA